VDSDNVPGAVVNSDVINIDVLKAFTIPLIAIGNVILKTDPCGTPFSSGYIKHSRNGRGNNGPGGSSRETTAVDP
jgi:hypothetical protein